MNIQENEGISLRLRMEQEQESKEISEGDVAAYFITNYQ